MKTTMSTSLIHKEFPYLTDKQKDTYLLQLTNLVKDIRAEMASDKLRRKHGK